MLLDVLPEHVREYVEKMARLMQPNDIYVCEGSDEEYEKFTNYMIENCGYIKLKKLKNW
jgi:GTP-dependent phosphoenolpyruvate carboxykinase